MFHQPKFTVVIILCPLAYCINNIIDYLSIINFICWVIHKFYRIQTFSIGMDSSPDVDAARVMAKYLDTEHHEVKFTPQEGIDALRKVIYTIESFDITTI